MELDMFWDLVNIAMSQGINPVSAVLLAGWLVFLYLLA